MPDKPLKGVVVCEYGQHGAGSACGKVLADWGADVVKVEPLWGCPSRMSGAMVGLSTKPDENAHFELINSGKRSIALNFKTKEGLEVMDKLIARSNIFCSNYRLGSLKKYGLDYETLSQKYPSLIWGHLSGYGPVGPKSGDPGYDNVSYWASSGLIMDPVDPNARPRGHAFGGGDVMTGFVLASSLAACLYQQATTGRGQSVYTSLFGAGIWQDSCVIQAAAEGNFGKSERDPYGYYRQCKDGVWFTMGLMDFPKYGPLMARLVGREDLTEVLSSRALTSQHREELCRIYDEFFARYTWAEVDEMLTAIDMVHNKVQRPGELAHDPQARANGYVWEHELRGGKKTTMVSTPVKFGRSEPIETTFAPLIGEHTTQILQELGYAQDEIDQLFAAGAVKEDH